MRTQITLKSKSAQLILDSLVDFGVEVQVVSKTHKLMRVTHQGKSFFIKGTSLHVNSQPSCIIANNKYLTKKVLKLSGISSPKSFLTHSREQVREVIRANNLFPCVLKPVVGAHGNKVYANIESAKELEQVMPNIFSDKKKKNILVEEYIAGKDYRVFVVGQKVSAIMERIPAHVLGDGKHTLRELISIFNSNPQVGKKYEKPMCKIRLNGEVERNLKKKGITMEFIPKTNEQIFLRQNANISTGGIGKDATNQAPKIVKTVALEAAKAVGMQITGVDVIYNQLTQKAYVLELNDQPGIDIHHFPVIGQAQNVARDIVSYLISQQTSFDSDNSEIAKLVFNA